MDEYIQYNAWFLESQKIRMQGDVEKHIVIMDVGGFSMWRYDAQKAFAGTHILQTCYPERLGLAVVVNVPMAAMAIWAVIKRWMDPETLAKFHLFGKSEKEKEASRALLLKVVAPEELLEQYGGTRSEPYPIPITKPTKGDDYPGGVPAAY